MWVVVLLSHDLNPQITSHQQCCYDCLAVLYLALRQTKKRQLVFVGLFGGLSLMLICFDVDLFLDLLDLLLEIVDLLRRELSRISIASTYICVR